MYCDYIHTCGLHWKVSFTQSDLYCRIQHTVPSPVVHWLTCAVPQSCTLDPCPCPASRVGRSWSGGARSGRTGVRGSRSFGNAQCHVQTIVFACVDD